jgi:hypothetical protein
MVSAIGPILEQLDTEPGHTASPFAAAATFLAIDQARDLRRVVQDALDRFAGRGSPAQEQVTKLRWRLDDHPRGYPRIMQVFR